jgi:cytochrome c553
MKPAHLVTTLFLLAALAACGDATPPEAETGAPQTEGAAPAMSDPADILAALPPEAQPYGLDIYTAKCVICHGDLGQGVGKNPALKGLTPAAMQQKLLDYRAGKTLGPQTAVMAQAVKSLSDADIAAVSIYVGE